MGPAILIIVVGLIAIGSAKPYERKSSSPNQYPLYPYGLNLVYPGADRISAEYLNRLFADIPRDSAGSVPFLSLGEKSTNDQYQEDERIGDMLDSELPDGENVVDNEQQPINPDTQKDVPADKPAGKAPTNDSEEEHKQQESPEKNAKEENERDVGKPQEHDEKILQEGDKVKEEPQKHHKRPQPEQSLNPGHNNGPRPEKERPVEGPSRRERPSFQQGRTNPRGRGPVPQPGSAGSRQAASPLVQINVNVASPGV